MTQEEASQILVVEDHPSNLRYISTLLQTHGYNVRTAISGELAIRSASAFPPDLLLLDIGLPGMNGFEVCKLLKQSQELKRIPVIFISGHDETEKKLKAFEMGGVDYVTKPFHDAELLSRVQTHLRLHQYEQRLAKQNELLQHTSEQYRQANEQLKSLNQDLKQFAYIVSHDLKAPLRNITMLSEWLAEELGELEEKPQRYFRLMLEKIRLMQELLDGILAYSKAGRIHAPTRTFRFQQLLDQETRLLGLTDSSRFSFHYEGPADAEFKTPIAPLQTILRNLLDNAMKHHDKEKGEIHVLLQLRSDEFARISIRDDGPGISASHHKRIFEIFQQLHPGTEGSGLGLALVKKLVESYGGSMGLMSAPGLGTTFCFTWPLHWQPLKISPPQKEDL
jgi:signal transduction histidine kinase